MAETLLTVEHLIKKYGDQVILDDVSLDVKKGEVIVVVGPSGCGKSTLLRCINALEPIQGGVVKLGSEVINPKSKSLTRLRQKIGMVFQSYDLFPHLTVLDNILLAPTKVQKRSKDEVKEEAMKLLRRVGLEEKAGSYPRELSGGQKQRVAIVRALCMHPEILLFDEVTAALDPEMVREVLDVILDLAAQGRTMIIVTHEMQFARAVADRIIFLEGGKIQEDETPDTLIQRLKTKWQIADASDRVMHFDIQREEELFKGWKDEEFGRGKGLDYFINEADGIDVIIGGPPCQAYSVAGRVRDENGMRDDYRNYLFEHYLNVVNRYRPKAFVFENVPGILSAAPNGKPITDLIRKGFRDIGYYIIDDLRVAKVNATLRDSQQGFG